MMAQERAFPEEAAVAPSVPPPVDGGTGSVESLGTLVDGLLGDRAAAGELEGKVGGVVGAETPQDPPPSDAPAPVPDGTGTSTRGGRPGGSKKL